ncbi:ABC transporter ATP-binding protein [Spirillospora sp. NPDC029432]|uniref:ABC transporter ATP-binding protein n=1 Tax=Spirillospora sp. NPDC029432 TaxID=3154599 RepID=UPI003453A19D
MKSPDRPDAAAEASERDHAVLTVGDVHKHFRRANGQDVPAVDGVSLEVRAGECLVLLGPSGCGKTTLLRSIAGLEHPDSGRIEVEGRPVFCSRDRINRSPQQRRLSMVFQSYALWPNMSVFDNIAYPLRQRGFKRAQLKAEVRRAGELVGLDEILRSYPNHISGGQQQRVALARALVSGDSLVLFDEPLSNVDAKVRQELRIELKGLQHKLGFGAVYVTHDQEEAMELGHRIAVLEHGKIAQMAGPEELYSRPVSRYVATFVGSTNEIEGTVESVDADGAVLSTALGKVVGARVGPDVTAGGKAVAIFRPEAGRVRAERPDGPNAWEARRRDRLFSGTHSEYVVTHERVAYRVWSDGAPVPAEGEMGWLTVPPSDVHIFRP